MLILVLTLLVGATAAAIIVSQTAWFKNWLRGYIITEAQQYLNGTLSIERLGGNLFFGVEMENVGVSMDGSQVVAVKDLGLDYNLFQLLTKGLSVDSIRLDKPVIYLRREGDTWSLSRLVKKQETEADRTGPKRPSSGCRAAAPTCCSSSAMKGLQREGFSRALAARLKASRYVGSTRWRATPPARGRR